jgi:GH15 family glucan-1,4-alpha-glucosidase
VAVDRGIRIARRAGLEAPLEEWTAARDRIHAEVCERGFGRRKQSFTQAYGEDALDASLLLLPIVGFLPVEDPRVAGTIAAIALQNDVGLMSEEYDPGARRLLGNFPQAFSHIAYVNSAFHFHAAVSPVRTTGRDATEAAR